MKSSKSGVYFTLSAYLNLDKPHSQWSIATCAHLIGQHSIIVSVWNPSTESSANSNSGSDSSFTVWTAEVRPIQQPHWEGEKGLQAASNPKEIHSWYKTPETY